MAPNPIVREIIAAGRKCYNLTSQSGEDNDQIKVLNKLHHLMEKTTDEILLNSIDSIWLHDAEDSNNDIILEYLSILFKTCSFDDIRSQNRRPLILKQVIKLLNSSCLSTVYSSKVICCLIHECSLLPVPAISSIVDKILLGLSSRNNDNEENGTGSSIELLPQLLNRISSLPLLKINENQEITYSLESGSGVDYLDYCINKLTSIYWSYTVSLQLLAVFKVVNLSLMQEQQICSKIIHQLSSLTLEELPPFSYQILLFSRKVDGTICKGALICGLIEHIDCLDVAYNCESASKEQQGKKNSIFGVEATILHHFINVLTRDHTLATFVFREMKYSRSLFSRFRLGLFLSMATITKFQEAVIDFLTEVLANESRLCYHTDVTPWFQKQHDLLHKRETFTIISIETLLLNLAKNNSAGWEYSTTSLVQLAIHLVEFRKKTESGFSKHLSDIGVSLLATAYQYHKIVQEYILQHAIAMLITNSPHSQLYLVLVGKLVQMSPNSLLDKQDKIKQVLDYLTSLNPFIAMGFLSAIHTLLVASQQLKDYLVLVLKKAVFRKEENIRRTALEGFMFLFTCQENKMTNLTQDYSQSLNTSSATSTVATWNLFLETCGFFRRCLTQQSKIRECVYKGCFALFKEHFHVRQAIFDLLVPQFLRYYDPNDSAQPPLKLDLCQCLTSATITEPLPALLTCIHHCINESQSSQDSNSIHKDIMQTMEVLAERMSNCSIEDFDLDHKTDLSINSIQGRCNRNTAFLLIDVLETFINFWIKKELSQSNLIHVLKLFSLIQQLNKILLSKTSNKPLPEKKNELARKQKSKPKSSKKNNFVSLFSPSTKPMLDISCIMKLLELQDDDLTEFKSENNDFFHYVLEKCHCHISYIRTNMPQCNPYERMTQRELCFRLSSLLFICFKREHETRSTGSSISKSNKPSISFRLLSIFYECLLATTKPSLHRKSLERVYRFLKSVFIEEIDIISETQVHNSDFLNKCVEEFQVILKELILRELYEEANIVVKILLHLIVLLPEEKRCHNSIQAKEISFNMEIVAHPLLVKSLISFYLIYARSANNLNPLEDIAKALQTYLRTIDDEDAMDSSIIYCNMNDSTVNYFALSIIHELALSVKDIEALIREYVYEKKASDQEEIYQRLTQVFNVFGLVLKIRLTTTICISLLRLLTRAYKIFISIVKTRIASKKRELPKTFLLLLDQAQRDMSPLIAQFITYFNNKTIQEKRKVSNDGKQAVMQNQNKVVPDLIFQLEKSDASMVRLSKLCKDCGFDRWCKRRTIRDFRLNSDKVIATLERAQTENIENIPVKKQRIRSANSRKRKRVPFQQIKEESSSEDTQILKQEHEDEDEKNEEDDDENEKNDDDDEDNEDEDDEDDDEDDED